MVANINVVCSDIPLSYSLAFRKAVTFVLIIEGALYADGTPKDDLGYVNDPTDPGGETKGGISKRAFPHLDIKNLTLEKIVSLYHVRYWRAAHCLDWSAPVALMVFDAAVQHGPVTAIELLQEISGVKADGKVGPLTRAAVASLDSGYLVNRYSLRRARFYARIITKNQSQTRFIEGWHNRLVDLVDSAWTFL